MHQLPSSAPAYVHRMLNELERSEAIDWHDFIELCGFQIGDVTHLPSNMRTPFIVSEVFCEVLHHVQMALYQETSNVLLSSVTSLGALYEEERVREVPIALRASISLFSATGSTGPSQARGWRGLLCFPGSLCRGNSPGTLQ